MIYLTPNGRQSITRPTLPGAATIVAADDEFEDWTLLMWCIPRTALAAGQYANLVTFTDGTNPCLSLSTASSTALFLQGEDTGGGGTEWTVKSVSQTISPLEPFLACVTSKDGRGVQVACVSAGAAAAVCSGARNPANLAVPTQLVVGGRPTSNSGYGSWNNQYIGLLAFAIHDVALFSTADADITTALDAIWAEGNPAAALYSTTGTLDGENTLTYHMGMGMMGAAGYREVSGYGGAAGTAQYPGTPGTLLLDRTLIYDADASYNPTGDNNHQVQRLVTVDHGVPTASAGATDGPYNASHLDHPWNSAEVFSRLTLGTEISTTEHVLSAAEGVNFPISRELALNRPRGIRRLVVDGVSRASNYIFQDADGHMPAYAGGFTAALGDNVIGVDCLPLFSPTSAVIGRGCFSCGYPVYDQPEQSAVLVTPTTGVKRFGKGAPGAGTGGGDFREVSVGQTARMMFGPQGGLTAQNAMRCAVHVLHYPGGGAFTLRSALDVGQAATSSETLGTESSEHDTDTGADVTRTFADATDTYSAGSGDALADLEITGTSLEITVGMVCVRDGTYDMAIVKTVAEAGGKTQLELEHNLETEPSNGEDLLFGEWDFVTYTVDHDALAEGATVDWRGFEITASAGTRGVMVMGVGGWATDRWGWVVCAGGVGATTYLAQQAEMNTIGPSGTSDGAEVRWHSEIENPDVYILTPTFHEVATNDIDNIIAMIGTAVPTAERVVFADGAWGLWDEADFVSGYKDVNDFWVNGRESPAILGAAGKGIPGVTIYNDTGIGWDCYMNGDLLNSSEHMSSRGYAFRVELFLAGLATATANVDDMDDIDYALAKDLRAGKYNQQGQVRGTMPQPMVSI